MKPIDLREALKAARSWYEREGRPATWWEWERSQPGQPSARTISRRWGWQAFWSLAIDAPAEQLYPAADLAKPDGLRRQLQWSSEEMLEALQAAHRSTGRWPSAGEWEKPTEEHPSRRTYVRRFGSWEEALVAANHK